MFFSFDRRRNPNNINLGPRPPHPDWRNEPMSDRPEWEQEREHGNWHRDGPDRFDERNPNWGNRRGPPPGPPGPGMMGPPDDSALIPKVPYYDLPAGLMAPLVNVSYRIFNDMLRCDCD